MLRDNSIERTGTNFMTSDSLRIRPCSPCVPWANLLPRSLVAAALALIFSGISFGASAASRPNSLFILADDLGWGDLSG